MFKAWVSPFQAFQIHWSPTRRHCFRFWSWGFPFWFEIILDSLGFSIQLLCCSELQWDAIMPGAKAARARLEMDCATTGSWQYVFKLFLQKVMIVNTHVNIISTWAAVFLGGSDPQKIQKSRQPCRCVKEAIALPGYLVFLHRNMDAQVRKFYWNLCQFIFESHKFEYLFMFFGKQGKLTGDWAPFFSESALRQISVHLSFLEGSVGFNVCTWHPSILPGGCLQLLGHFARVCHWAVVWRLEIVVQARQMLDDKIMIKNAMIHAADKDDWFILDQILLEISQPRCQRLLGVNGRIVYLFGKRPKVKRYDEASKFPSVRFFLLMCSLTKSGLRVTHYNFVWSGHYHPVRCVPVPDSSKTTRTRFVDKSSSSWYQVDIKLTPTKLLIVSGFLSGCYARGSNIMEGGGGSGTVFAANRNRSRYWAFGNSMKSFPLTYSGASHFADLCRNILLTRRPDF